MKDSNKRERRTFTWQQKTAIVKAHQVNDKSVADLCDEHNIQPTQFYAWQKQLFENGAAVFEKTTNTSTLSTSKAKIKQQQPHPFC